MSRTLMIVAFLLALGAAAFVVRWPSAAGGSGMNALAERYVRLVLAVGQHDADYVDAYYGDPEWRTQAEKAKVSLTDIDASAAALARDLAEGAPSSPREDAGDESAGRNAVRSARRSGPTSQHWLVASRNDATIRETGEAELIRLRHRYLSRQLEALQARVKMLSGRKLEFDEESKALYDAVAPTHSPDDFQAVLAELDTRLPGEGSLLQRYDAFRSRFVIPRDRLDATFKAAIEGCRERTMQHITLPPGESFTVEYVTNKSWSGYNWYQGNFRSLIQVNTDLPIYAERAIDLACHEGYPGHHVYNALLEKNLVRDRGWVEYSVYPLFSPQSLIAEGTANYGIEVAFPREERLDFERRVIFPAAGLDPAGVGPYYDVLALADRLSYAGNEAARRYLNGEIDASGAADWLEKYGLYTHPRAEQRVRFMDQYRSYVINYNLGKDMVKRYIESQPDRWKAFEALISSPRLPSSLVE